MKRLNNLYQDIISIENLKLADSIARKGKRTQYGVILHDRNAENNILNLHNLLANNQYKTMEWYNLI
jgi:hypothetical protein